MGGAGILELHAGALFHRERHPDLQAIKRSKRPDRRRIRRMRGAHFMAAEIRQAVGGIEKQAARGRFNDSAMAFTVKSRPRKSS